MKIKQKHFKRFTISWCKQVNIVFVFNRGMRYIRANGVLSCVLGGALDPNQYAWAGRQYVFFY